MLNLLKSRIDAGKVSLGTYWEVDLQEDGTLIAVPISTPAATKKGWVRVTPPGVDYTRAIAEARKEFLPQIRSGKVDDITDVRIRGTAVATTLLQEWGNILIGKEELYYSRDQALKLLTNIEWRNFLGLIESIAENRAALLHEEARAAEGNSNAELSGSSSKDAPLGDKSS